MQIPRFLSSSDRERGLASIVVALSLLMLLAPYDQKSSYFLSDRTPHEPVGNTGADNFWIMAETAVLVQ